MTNRNMGAVLAATGAIALVGVMSVPAGADTSGHMIVKGTSASLHFQGGYPTSMIKRAGKTAFFKPSALTVTEDTSGGDCQENIPPVSFVIVNAGTARAWMTLNGTPIGSLAPGDDGAACLYGATAGSKFVMRLTNTHDTKTYPGTLTIATSD